MARTYCWNLMGNYDESASRKDGMSTNFDEKFAISMELSRELMKYL
jgi:hypothetical protein